MRSADSSGRSIGHARGNGSPVSEGGDGGDGPGAKQGDLTAVRLAGAAQVAHLHCEQDRLQQQDRHQHQCISESDKKGFHQLRTTTLLYYPANSRGSSRRESGELETFLDKWELPAPQGRSLS